MTPAKACQATGRAHLAEIAVPTDRLSVSGGGELLIDGTGVAGLLERYGSPLAVTVERTILANFEAIRSAFSARWPGGAQLLYSFKSNNSLAIRHLLSRAGAGGDCFGENELRATLEAGTDPARIVLNGSDKSEELIAQAIDAGVVINIDGEDEVDFIERHLRGTSRRATVNLRLKVLPEDLPKHAPALGRRASEPLEWVRRAKWGYLPEQAARLVERLTTSDAIDLAGYSCHIGHLSNRPDAFAAVARALGQAVNALAAETGFRPRILDLGGGWAREREPEQGAPGAHPKPPGAGDIDAQAEAATKALRGELGGYDELPELWIEPGRYLVGNGDVLLARVGAIKCDGGRCWLHLDISTNFLPRIETGQFHYHLLPASRMDEPLTEKYEVVGGTCFRSVIGSDRMMPAMRRGDVVAILDAGMYSWSLSNTLNCVPRPANVLLAEEGSQELVRRRETFADLFATQSVPEKYRRPATRQEQS